MATESCFVIMSFSEALKEVYDAAIKPAVEGKGLECIRVDEIEGTGNIIRQIVECVHEAKVIIADLTEQKPNVFYELGMAHALGNNVIVLAQDIKRDVPFDVRSYKVIRYANTIAGGIKLEQEIGAAIETLDEWSKGPSNPVQDFLPPDARPVPPGKYKAAQDDLQKVQQDLEATKTKLAAQTAQKGQLQSLKEKNAEWQRITTTLFKRIGADLGQDVDFEGMDVKDFEDMLQQFFTEGDRPKPPATDRRRTEFKPLK